MKSYYEIFPSMPGGLQGNEFVFDNWNGVEVIQNGTDIFVTSAIKDTLFELNLVTQSQSIVVKKESQYDEICALDPPKQLHKITIATSPYESDLFFADSKLVCTKPIVDVLKKLTKKLRSKKCIPLSFKFTAPVASIDGDIPNSIGSWKDTNLHWEAAKSLPLNILNEYDTPDQFGLTPLHEAIAAGNIQGAAALLDRGANINKKTKHGFDGIEIAIRFDRVELIELFLQREILQLSNSLYSAVFSAKAKRCAQKLASLIQDVDQRDSEEDFTFLMHAIRWGDIALCERLIKMGANPNSRRIGMHQTTPLGLAIAKWDAAMVEFLLKAGADPNLSVIHTITSFPLSRSIVTDSDPEITRLLLEYGADKTLHHSEKHTIEQYARNKFLSSTNMIIKEKCKLVIDYD